MEALLAILLAIAVLAVLTLMSRNADLSARNGVLEGEIRATQTEFDVRLQTAIDEKEQFIRKDAAKRSQSTTIGKAVEHFIPYLPDFAYNPKDARFLGTPVDFVVFDGLSDGQVRGVAFVEVKIGTSELTVRERQVRNAVRQGRVHWVEVRHAMDQLPGSGLSAGVQEPPIVA